MSAGSEEYYLSLIRYYTDGLVHDTDDVDLEITTADYENMMIPGERPGRWYGGATTVLRLNGIVEADALRSVFQGYDPRTGEPLVQNAGSPRRCPGWDLCCSAPKDLSVIWSQASPETRKVIERIHRQAVESMLQFVEYKLAFSRVGKAADGCDVVRAGMAFAIFPHATNREGEPQLHEHCLALNLGIDKNGEARSIISSPLYRNKMLLGAYYRAKLASLICSELNRRTERRGRSFGIVGIRKEVREAHSTRSKQIRRRMKERGESGAVAAAVAALDTRRKKEEPACWAELFPRWQSLNESMGFTQEYIRRLPKARKQSPANLLEKALAEATRSITNEQNHFSEAEFLLHTLWVLPNYGLAQKESKMPSLNT